jgi:hypothetical protein
LLNARDKGCRFPGCANTRYLDAHHVHHWADGGETKPSNLVSLCRFHHRTKQSNGWALHHLYPGVLLWITPTGSWRIVGPAP